VGNVDDEDLQELWARLLASAMVDNENQHPAYISILQQFSPDEAKIFSLFKTVTELAFINLHYQNRAVDVVCTFPNEAGCAHPDRVRQYVGNLERLGLIQKLIRTRTAHSVLQGKPLEEVVQRLRDRGVPGYAQQLVILYPTSFGRAFLTACVGALAQPPID
jgi:hypothetical protein